MGVSSKMRWSWVSRHSLCVTLRTFQILITPSSPPVARYLRSTLNFIHQIAFLGVSYTVHDGRVFSQLLTDVKIGELLVALFHHRHLDRAFHVVVLLRITKRIERNGGLWILIFSICDYTNCNTYAEMESENSSDSIHQTQLPFQPDPSEIYSVSLRHSTLPLPASGQRNQKSTDLCQQTA